MNSKFLKLIILNYFRIIFALSIIGKIIYNVSFHSYVVSFFKYLGVNKFLYENNLSLDLFIAVVYFIIQGIEMYLVFISYRNPNIFIRKSIYLFTFFLVITGLAVTFNISGDCGCFGDIIVFENSFDKIYFLLLNIISGITILVFKKDKTWGNKYQF